MSSITPANYRPDIDGLRSIAVMLVVIYHAGFYTLSGGFIGVDVFFVLSGYLITTIIYRDIRAQGFSYANFYNRRIRRLLPAAIFVFIFSSLLGIFILLPDELVAYAKSLFLAFISLSNIYFWRENGGYFEGDSEEVPLLHTWSLSVEEQFYFIWPALLIIALKMVKHRWLVYGLAATFIIAIIFSEWATRVTIGAAYYLLPTRMFELMGGAVLAIAWQDIPQAKRWLNNLLSLAGIVLIIASGFMLNADSPFPGINALYATLGTMLLIYSGKGDQIGWTNRLLSLKPFVFIGLISYSLYLWHWPVIVYTRLLGIPLGGMTSIIVIAVSMVMAWISYALIEKRFRYVKDVTFSKTFQRWFLIPLFIITCFSGWLIWQKGLPQRFPQDIINKYKAHKIHPDILRAGCHFSSRDFDTPVQTGCVFGDTANPSSAALMIGDSHANHFTGLIDELTKNNGIKVTDYTLDACMPIFDVGWGRNAYYAQVCQQHNDISREFIAQNALDYVIFAANWPTAGTYRNLFNDGKALENTEQQHQLLKARFISTFRYVEERGARPVLVMTGFPSGDTSSICPLKQQLFNPRLECNADRQLVDNRDTFMRNLISEVRAQVPALIVIDPVNTMCDEESCPASVNGMPLFRDTYHYNDSGSRAIGKSIIALGKNPFAAAEQMEPAND